MHKDICNHPTSLPSAPHPHSPGPYGGIRSVAQPEQLKSWRDSSKELDGEYKCQPGQCTQQGIDCAHLPSTFMEHLWKSQVICHQWFELAPMVVRRYRCPSCPQPSLGSGPSALILIHLTATLLVLEIKLHYDPSASNVGFFVLAFALINTICVAKNWLKCVLCTSINRQNKTFWDIKGRDCCSHIGMLALCREPAQAKTWISSTPAPQFVLQWCPQLNMMTDKCFFTLCVLAL